MGKQFRTLRLFGIAAAIAVGASLLAQYSGAVEAGPTIRTAPAPGKFRSAITSTPSKNPAATIQIDASMNRHAINPLIYGVAVYEPYYPQQTILKMLNSPLNRLGGNLTTTYNWKANTWNLEQDYYWESYPLTSPNRGAEADQFVQSNKRFAAGSMITIPMIGYVAKLGANRSVLSSFSVAKYGSQCYTDWQHPDAGDGVEADCATNITGNDPTDAYVVDSLATETAWVKHLVGKWGTSSAGGVGYYLMDNEPGIWFSTHRDIHPVGLHAIAERDNVIATSAAIKAIDPTAKIVATEEDGWAGYQYSGYDRQYSFVLGLGQPPDFNNVQGGVWYVPWLLGQWKASGHPVDVVSVHFYPGAGEFGEIGPGWDYYNSPPIELLRNRSTRQLWDPNYNSETSWIATPVQLIPRIKSWVGSYYYSGTPVAITEYNWGDQAYISGATAEADVLGIFGQQGLDMATFFPSSDFVIPPQGYATTSYRDNSSPAFKAIQMYRNYDGANSTFGDLSIAATVANPDNLSAFAALRQSDGAMTIMVISKVLSGSTATTLNLSHFSAAGSAQVFRLDAGNKIVARPALAWSGGVLHDTEPAQSITLYVLPKGT